MKFIFEKYDFDFETGVAEFWYGFEGRREFVERVEFELSGEVPNERREVLERALWLAFMVMGTSYYKCFPGREVEVRCGLDGRRVGDGGGGVELDRWQAEFFGRVYQEGLGQFAYENDLGREDLAVFAGEGVRKMGVRYDGAGDLVLQSGGKDSLLVAAWLERIGHEFAPCMVTSGEHYPKVLNELNKPLVTVGRRLDREGLAKAAEDGALSGHVPVTYIMMSIAVVQAVLLGKNRVLVSIGHEGAEANARLADGMEVNHQWSKSWGAERDFVQYVEDYVSPDIKVGSPLRGFSELLVAEMFARVAWERFGGKFSSCNVANYRQGVDNSELKWCGNCPKCANSYLIFAPFVEGDELRALFGGQELFEKESLEQAFKGMLGIDGVMKPFECVGEVEELRVAYRLAQEKGGYGVLPFAVLGSEFDWRWEYEGQGWARELMNGVELDDKSDSAKKIDGALVEVDDEK